MDNTESTTLLQPYRWIEWPVTKQILATFCSWILEIMSSLLKFLPHFVFMLWDEKERSDRERNKCVIEACMHAYTQFARPVAC